jgi:hypothetical protein
MPAYFFIRFSSKTLAMKKQLRLPWIICLLVLSLNTTAQVGIGTTAPNPSAGLDIYFPDKGLLLPQVDLNTYLGTLGSPAAGLMVYNTSTLFPGGPGLFFNSSATTTASWNKIPGIFAGTNAENRVAVWGAGSTLKGNSNFYWDDANNRLGIGTTVPTEQLTITENLELPNTSATAGIILKGGQRYIHNYGDENLYIGQNAGNLVLSGIQNVGLGNGNLSALTTGDINTAIGDYALPMNTTGHSNVAIGGGSMVTNTTCNFNIAIGTYSLFSQGDGQGDNLTANIAIGGEALAENNPTSSTNGRYNVAIGYQSLTWSATGSNNIALGHKSMYGNADCSENIAIGTEALYWMTNGNGVPQTDNSAIGHQALYNTAPTTSIDGRCNIGIGYQALYENITGKYNSGLGYMALSDATGSENTAMGFHAQDVLTTGERNTSVGAETLNQNQSGSDNTAIGAYAGVSTSALSNTVAVGAAAVANASNQVRLGNTSISSLYCYGAYAATTTSPANLYVASDGQIMRSTAKNVTDQLQNHDEVIKQLEQRLGEKDREIEKLRSEIEAIRAIVEGMVSK